MVNKIEKSKYWPSTAIVLTYDVSDAGNDHVCAHGWPHGPDNSSIDTTMCEGRPGDGRDRQRTPAARASGCR